MMRDQSALSYILSLPRFAERGAAAYRPGLDRIRKILAEMDDPHRRYRTIHVAGTNGKGSTASMIASISREMGLRTGLHTSPHLVHLGERMRVDGEAANPGWLEGAGSAYRNLFADVGASFFEATTALSFLYFSEQDVDLAVIEVGMGGRLDATNVILPDVSVITRIGLDHTEFLGSDLPSIAREKAGIAKRATPLVLYPAPREVARTVRTVSAEIGARLHEVEREVRVSGATSDAFSACFTADTPVGRYEDLRVPLGGDHQVENAVVALRTAELALPEIHDHAVRNGLAEVCRNTGFRGRLEILAREPLIVADVAHNEAGIGQALNVLRAHALRSGGRLLVVIGLMADKDISGIARLLSSTVHAAFCVSLDSARALTAANLENTLTASGIPVAGSGGASEGIALMQRMASPHDVILVVGSHLVVGQLLSDKADDSESAPFGTTFAK